MKNRILSIALALCMVAVVFVSVPAKGEIYYTGSVQTTDDTGELKDVFFQGDHVYVNVELYFEGELTMDNIRVRLLNQDGGLESTFDAITDEPIDGYYNSSDVDIWLSADVPFDGDLTVCDVVVLVNGIYGWAQFTSTQIIVKRSGVTLDPSSYFYYPGQDVAISVLTGEDDAFRVEITNETDHMVDHWDYQTANVDGVWSVAWTVPADAKDGTYDIRVIWEVSDTTWYHDTFEIAKYFLMIGSDRSVVLPGESIAVEYMVLDMATLTFYTDVQVEWSATWFNNTGVQINATGELAPSYKGIEIFTIPASINLTSDYEITFWANDSDVRTQQEYIEFSVGEMRVSVETDNDAYLAGEKVVLDVAVEVGGGSSEPLPDADVDIVIEKDGSELEEYGAAGLMTSVEGLVEHEFVLAADAEIGTYLVYATVSKIGNTVVMMTSFDIEIYSSFAVSLDFDDYWSGQNMVMTFETVWGVDRVYNNSVFYMIYGDQGIIEASNTTASSVMYQIPSDYVGDINVEAYTLVNGYFMDAYDDATVAKAYLALTANTYTYSGGDLLTWSYQIVTAMTNGSLSYVISDNTGETVASEILGFRTSGSFSFNAPDEEPANWYRATVTLKDGLGNNVVSSATIYLMNDYDLSIWVQSSSKTVSGAFEPGNVVTFGYSITTNGATHLSVYEIWFSSNMENQDWSFLTTGSSGTFAIEVPANLPDGGYEVWASLYNGISGVYLSGDWTPMGVESDQGLWEKDVAGMSMTDFTIMILLLVMIVLLIVVPFAKGRMGAPKPARPEHMTHAPPPPEEPTEPK
ncbi:MAG: hypothetical protein MUO84_01855 [Thermoplasmata archaeon]|nr:hypothetical protein [Thermoplasmata archaeon]